MFETLRLRSPISITPLLQPLRSVLRHRLQPVLRDNIASTAGVVLLFTRLETHGRKPNDVLWNTAPKSDFFQYLAGSTVIELDLNPLASRHSPLASRLIAYRF